MDDLGCRLNKYTNISARFGGIDFHKTEKAFRHFLSSSRPLLVNLTQIYDNLAFGVMTKDLSQVVYSSLNLMLTWHVVNY